MLAFSNGGPWSTVSIIGHERKHRRTAVCITSFATSCFIRCARAMLPSLRACLPVLSHRSGSHRAKKKEVAKARQRLTSSALMRGLQVARDTRRLREEEVAFAARQKDMP